MSAPKPASWWKEDQRGALLGYGTKPGNKWVHLTRLRDSGPGAFTADALCHGVEGYTMIDSGLNLSDAEACTTWKAGHVRVPTGSKLEDVMRPQRIRKVCPKCQASYEKQAMPQ